MRKRTPRYVLCISDEGDELSVVKRTLYRAVAPESNDPPAYIRVIDETGQDHLYDRSWFGAVKISPGTAKVLDALDISQIGRKCSPTKGRRRQT